jgi:hypothetical protein
MNLEFLDAYLPTWMHDPLWKGVCAALALLYVIASCRIFSRAGYSALLGTLMLVPGLNVLLLLWLGFASWPTMSELGRLRRLDDAVSTAQQRYSRAA